MTDFEAWLSKQRLGNTKLSSLIKAQLEKFLVENILNPFPILEEIRLLEGIDQGKSRTVPPKEFTKGLLKGLMHKHFVSGRFIAKNLQSHWSERKLFKLIGRKMRERGTAGDDPLRDWEWCGEAAREFGDAYWRRSESRSLTGEWIIYKSLGPTNYYLTLAGHDEDQGVIYQRIVATAAMDFPEIGLV